MKKGLQIFLLVLIMSLPLAGLVMFEVYYNYKVYILQRIEESKWLIHAEGSSKSWIHERNLNRLYYLDYHNRHVLDSRFFMESIRDVVLKETSKDYSEPELQYLCGFIRDWRWDSRNNINYNKSGKRNEREEPTYWFLQSARQGYAKAQGILGMCYKYGHGVEPDLDKCIYWLKRAADGGDACSQWRLGIIYAYGSQLVEATSIDGRVGHFVLCGVKKKRHWEEVWPFYTYHQYHDSEEEVLEPFSPPGYIYERFSDEPVTWCYHVPEDVPEGTTIWWWVEWGGYELMIEDDYFIRQKTIAKIDRDIEEALRYWNLAANNGLQAAKEDLLYYEHSLSKQLK